MMAGFGGVVSADEIIPDANGLYIQTDAAPDGAMQYAKENLMDFMMSHSEQNYAEVANYQLGSPFTLQNNGSGVDLYYFPVIENGSVVLTFRVYQNSDGTFGGVLGEALTTELNALKPVTSPLTPATILNNNGNIVSIVNGNVEIIYTDPESGTVNLEEISATPAPISGLVTNCLDTIEYTSGNNISTYAPDNCNLDPTILENQTKLPWCVAYATAMIVSYYSINNYKALDVMKWSYPTYPATQLEQTKLPNHKAIGFARSEAITSTEVFSALTVDEVKQKISNNKLIFMNCLNPATSGRHAIVLKGYSTSTYKVWNPWYFYFDTMPRGTVYVATDGTVFNWDNSIIFSNY